MAARARLRCRHGSDRPTGRRPSDRCLGPSGPGHRLGRRAELACSAARRPRSPRPACGCKTSGARGVGGRSSASSSDRVGGEEVECRGHGHGRCPAARLTVLPKADAPTAPRRCREAEPRSRRSGGCVEARCRDADQPSRSTAGCGVRLDGIVQRDPLEPCGQPAIAVPQQGEIEDQRRPRGMPGLGQPRGLALRQAGPDVGRKVLRQIAHGQLLSDPREHRASKAGDVAVAA